MLLKTIDTKQLKHRPAFRNFALGVGEWTSSREPILAKWPLFVNFDENIVAEFVHQILKGSRPSIGDFIKKDARALWENPAIPMQLEGPAGTTANPAIEKMAVTFEVEPCNPRLGSKFLFLISKKAAT